MPADNYEIMPGTDGIAPERSLTTWYQFATKTHFWIQWRNRAILDLAASNGMSPSAPLRIMDIGSGQGVVHECLEPLTQWTFDGVDIDRDALEMSKTGRGRRLYYDITAKDESFRETYDAVLLLDVLEHIRDRAEFLEAALFHLKPGGGLIVSAPALRWLFSAYDKAAGHLRRYDRKSLSAEFDGLSAAPVDVRYWGLSLIPVVLVRGLLQSNKSGVDDILRSGFAPPLPFVNALMAAIMRAETALMKRPPLGASIVLFARKSPV